MAASKIKLIKTRNYDSGFALLFALGALILLGSMSMLVQSISVQSSLSTKKLSAEIRSDLQLSSKMEFIKPVALEFLLQQSEEKEELEVMFPNGFRVTLKKSPSSREITANY